MSEENLTLTKVKKSNKNLGIKRWTPFLFIAPAAITMLLVVVYPLCYEIGLSFRNVNLANLISGKYPFIGFDNYKRILKDSLFYSTLLRTLIWTAVNVIAHLTLGVMLAVLLNRKLPGKKLIRLILILPWAIPQYIATLIWRGMYNYEYGAVNIILTRLFGHGAAIDWLGNPNWTFVGAIITNIWLGVPFMMMIAFGGMQSINKELYEAADIDGASGFQKLKSITLPQIKPVMTPAIVLGVVWTFNLVNILVILTNGSTSESSQILVTLVYKRAFDYYKYGWAAAFSVIIFIILLCYSYFFIKAQKLEE